MRAIVYFTFNKGSQYLNIPADKINYECGWIFIYKEDNLVAVFGEEIVDCCYLSSKEKTDRNAQVNAQDNAQDKEEEK